jgi:hypothetical protein
VETVLREEADSALVPNLDHVLLLLLAGDPRT